MLRVRVASSGWDGGPGLNTFYFSGTTENAADAQVAHDRVRAALAASFNGIWANRVTGIVAADVDVINASNGQITNTHTVTASAAVLGTSGASILPTSTALMLRLGTGGYVGGRKVRGRVYVSPMGLGVADNNGAPVIGLSVGVAAFANAMTFEMTNGVQWVVWHRPKLGVGGLALNVTTCTFAPKFAVLRSRRD